MEKELFRASLQEAAAAYGLMLTTEQLAQFTRYYELLIAWNEKMNLTALTEPKDVAIKHMIDSVSVYDEKWFSEGMSVIDVGTGAGFPGLPLKILCPSLKVTLLDSLNKRVKFLETVVSELGLSDIVCVHARAEEPPEDLRESFDLACSRAVARLNLLSELCLPYVKQGGLFAAMKGPEVTEELREAEKGIRLLGGETERVAEYPVPGTELRHNAVLIRKIAATPKKYPRKWAAMKKQPL